ncbi:DUF2795 domain-containing protein [Streptomyces sp. G45]|uniref:DUF2795 domain-containing protein n=1 Tax=Streptomyces sp. G45 TaxID=3406627 RepID=UPI003C21BE8E
MTDRGQNKTGPLRDDELKKRTRGELKAAHATRAQEEREPEPPGEDQPAVDRMPRPPRPGSTPPGLSPEQAELRSELARHLGRGPFPADRAAILAALRAHHAPDSLLDIAARLPAEGRYDTAQDVVRTLTDG